jgi:hypothetical protein
MEPLMASSPLNYFEGKGILSFTPAGGTKRDLGNAPSVRFAPDIQTREHRSSRSGVSSVDRTVIQSQSLNVEITLDEITIDNLALALLGTVATDEITEVTSFGIYEATEIKGALELVGTNDIGNRFTVVVNEVTFIPGEGFDFISDDWGVISLTGTASRVEGTGFGTVTLTLDAAAVVVPE